MERGFMHAHPEGQPLRPSAHSMHIIESFIKDKKVTLLEDDGFPEELIVNNTDEVKSRAHAAGARIKKGNFVSQDDYRVKMDAFLETLL